MFDIMSFIKVLLLTVLIESTLVSGNKWDCADFYWRDYFGTLPEDAIPAGKDHNGDKVYIGLVYIRGYELLPASIFPKQKLAQTSAHGILLNTKQHVKILCSPHEEAFEWTAIQSQDLHEYTNRNLIPGGSEVGASLYIGRVFRNNDVIVGKIFPHELVNKGIWFPFNNGHANSLSYDILSYNCDKVIGFDPRASFPNKKSKTVSPQ